MADLFDQTCPCCGQKVPQGQMQSSAFDDFWRDVPRKIGKDAARKAWGKLPESDRNAAHDAVKSWYKWFEKTYPGASPLHPSTYLNNRRWQDEGWRPDRRAETVDRAAIAADRIRSGKRYLCTHITPAQARELIHRGMVTEGQCRAAGVQP